MPKGRKYRSLGVSERVKKMEKESEKESERAFV